MNRPRLKIGEVRVMKMIPHRGGTFRIYLPALFISMNGLDSGSRVEVCLTERGELVIRPHMGP